MKIGAVLDETPQSAEHDGRLKQSTRPTLLSHAVFLALGLLFLVSAGFKTYEVYSQPVPTPRVVGALSLICFEITLGVWLLLGTRSAWTLRVTAACFAAFAAVSAYKLMTGASSCGCFGTLQISPAITLVIDVAAVVLLILCRAGVEAPFRAKQHLTFPAVASLATVLSSSALFISLYSQGQFAQSDGSLTMGGDLVVLNPKSWVGKPWPLLGELGLPTGLASGEWDVLLFRHDCHACHEIMRELEPVLSTQSERHRTALIGIDEQSDDVQTARLQRLGCVLAYLPEDREWFATTPLRLCLRDGVCVSAAVIEHWE